MVSVVIVVISLIVGTTPDAGTSVPLQSPQTTTTTRGDHRGQSHSTKDADAAQSQPETKGDIRHV